MLKLFYFKDKNSSPIADLDCLGLGDDMTDLGDQRFLRLAPGLHRFKEGISGVAGRRNSDTVGMRH